MLGSCVCSFFSSSTSLSLAARAKEKYQDRTLWLEYHYRSNEEIIRFSQKHIYDGRIKIHDSCKEIKLDFDAQVHEFEYLSPDKPSIFIDVDGIESYDLSNSKFNEGEIETACKVIGDLLDIGFDPKEIACITPFRAQKKMMEGRISNNRIEVNTVDAFQGREKDIILYSVTATGRLNFAEDPNRLNVAFTRPRRKRIVLGNGKSILNSNGLLRKFYLEVSETTAVYKYVKSSKRIEAVTSK